MLDESQDLRISMQPVSLEIGGNPSSNLGGGVKHFVIFEGCIKLHHTRITKTPIVRCGRNRDVGKFINNFLPILIWEDYSSI